MYVPETNLSANQILSVFHHDEPFLFLGSAFTTVALVTAAFCLLRRKFDALLVYFALFAFLYGQRLWIQSGLLDILIPQSMFFDKLRSVSDYLVPIPAFLFFSTVGFINRRIKVAGYTLTLIMAGLAIATVVFGPSHSYHMINNVVVIVALVGMIAQSIRNPTADRDFVVIRAGLFVFVALALWDNVAGAFGLRSKIEPYGFVVLLGALGYVAARRTLQRDQQLNQIQKELEVAQRIQLSILPADFPNSANFRVAARYLPMSAVAGDFYDFIVADEKQAGLLIADVSGHGVPAALIASMVKLAATAQRAHASDPAGFLAGMNAVLFGNTQQQFVTAAYVYLDSETRELRYSAAGHPAMLLLRAGQVTEIVENGLILAAFDPVTYCNVTHRLEPGDRLLLYTDGILEAADGKGDFFGSAALCALVQQTGKLSPADAAERIVSVVRQWSPSQEDDLTVMVCDYASD
jgi:sigma-B regulation protein RsbU (phosphoserine phosphatase)